jgi:hypothetical protein
MRCTPHRRNLPQHRADQDCDTDQHGDRPGQILSALNHGQAQDRPAEGHPPPDPANLWFPLICGRAAAMISAL